MLTFHTLKTWPLYFRAVVDRRKLFEVRKADRDFQVGDILILEEYEPDAGYTGRSVSVYVSYVMRDLPFVPDGYVIMGLWPVSVENSQLDITTKSPTQPETGNQHDAVESVNPVSQNSDIGKLG